MITYVVGDLFYSPARVLVNAANTVGVMGKGVAYDFKRFYPSMFAAYRERCQEDAFDIGDLMLYRTPHKWVLNVPTKRHYRAQSRPEYIEAGLKKFVELYAEAGITSVSFPRLGTGSGGLDWDDEVRPLMESYLDRLPINIFIHHHDEDDDFAPERRNVRAIRAWLERLPGTVTVAAFWEKLKRLLAAESRYRTLDGSDIAFTARFDKRKRGLHLALPGDDPAYIPASALGDLWQYITRAGYVLPANLPSGLDAYAPALVGLLAGLDVLRPVRLATVNGTQQVGLHYIPPSLKDDPARQVALTRV